MKVEIADGGSGEPLGRPSHCARSIDTTFEPVPVSRNVRSPCFKVEGDKVTGVEFESGRQWQVPAAGGGEMRISCRLASC